ncbi:MAG: hypothetical protein ACSHW7_00595 [Patiriisocius sp.]|uniref:hypothetical protein n=1 Tax=Patiriisocius sp. TaxID=2822396 RepID=UPI003EF82FEF
MKQETILPIEIENLINSINRNKTFKKSLIEVFNSLVFLKKTKPEWKFSKRGLSRYSYFDAPSDYLKGTNSRYKQYVNILLENKIIDYYSKNERIIERNLFEDDVIDRIPYYDTNNNQCIKYRFLIDIDQSENQNFLNLKSSHNKNWYKITRDSLKELGLDGIIKRDGFGRRLHTRVTMNIGAKIETEKSSIEIKSYKEYLRNFFKGNYAVVDASCCQPTIMYEQLKTKGVIDPNFNYPFENNLDFYQYLADMGLSIDRNDAKSRYTKWQNGRYHDTEGNFENFFKISTDYIRKIKKTKGHKKICEIITRMESKIFIDDLLSNINLGFCLTIHDSLLVRTEDLPACMEYCNKKYGHIFNFRSETF